VAEPPLLGHMGVAGHPLWRPATLGGAEPPPWPMGVVRPPKGKMGRKKIDGFALEVAKPPLGQMGWLATLLWPKKATPTIF
jgi:hypothetical protein